MSDAEELGKLHQLHLSGALSDTEFESAKARVLGASEKASSDLSVPAAPVPAAESRMPRSVTWVVVLLIIFGGGWLFLRQTVGEHAANRVAATIVHAPLSLHDGVENLPASSWKAVGLALPYTGNLAVTVQVTAGNPVDVFVVDERNLQLLQAKAQRFEQFAAFEAMEARTYQRSARLNQGVYYLVLRDRSLGILSSRTSDINVVARLEP